MNRECHAFLVHLCNKEAHGGDHDDGVAGLDGNDHIMELLTHTDSQELHARLHHTLRRVAIARHDAVGQ